MGNKDKIKSLVVKSPQKLALRKGKTGNLNLVGTKFDWIIQQRQSELGVSTLEIVYKAVSLLPNFEEEAIKKRLYWVYYFMKRRNIYVWTRTRNRKVLDAAMQPAKDADCHRIMAWYNLRTNNLKYLANMNETAIHLNCAPKRTKHLKGENIVPVKLVVVHQRALQLQ